MRATRRSVGPVGILALAAALLLAGCGGGGGGGGGAADLRGTVAEGAPLASVPVVTMDAGGASASTTTDGSGRFSFPGPFAFPVLVQAQTPFGNLYGWALGPGTANVTSLTTLALVVNTGLPDDLDTVFAGFPGTGVAAVNASAMHAAQAVVNANLSTQMTAAGVDPTTYDFATATFPPVGSGIDAVLDGLDVAFDFGAGTFALAEAGGGPAVPFDPNIDFSGFGVGGATSVGSFGAYTVILTGVTLDGEDITGTTFRPDAPVVGTVSGTPAASTYAFTTEPIGFVTPAGRVLAQTFTATVDTADGATLRRIEYTLALASDAASTITFAMDCTGVTPPCGALVITPATGGTGGNHSLLTTSTVLDEEGAAGTPPTATLIGTLRTAAAGAASGGGGGGGGGSPFGSLTVGSSPPGLADAFTPDSTFFLGGAHWSRTSLDVTFPGFEGLAEQFLHIYFDASDPTVLTAQPQYTVAYVATVSGSPPSPANSFYDASCPTGCSAATYGISIDTSARTVTFHDTTLPADTFIGAVTGQVVLNGTLSY